MRLKLRQRALDLDAPRIMGVLNRTPDSFSDGGEYLTLDAALRRVEALLGEGADLIDIGGESTRPGAAPVNEAQELDRVVMLIDALHQRFDCLLSIDTTKPAVMRAACAAGAELINDTNALRSEDALQAAAECGAGVCLMHMQGQPRTMQQAPEYQNVVGEVTDFLRQRLACCEQAGIARERLCVDPGFGFGKNLRHNLTLLARLEALTDLGVPVLVGLSRKSMLGAICDRDVKYRLAAGIAAAALAVEHGALIVRTHDVGATLDAVKVAWAVKRARGNGTGGAE